MKQSYTNFDDLLSDVADGVEQIMQDVAPQIETVLQASAKKNIQSQSARSAGIEDASNIVSSVTRDGNTVTMIVKDIAKPQPSYFLGGKKFDSQRVADTLLYREYHFGGSPIVWNEYGGANILFDERENAAVGGTMFANWMENGLWMDLSYYLRSGGQKEYRPARPFIAPAQVEAAMVVMKALHGM